MNVFYNEYKDWCNFFLHLEPFNDFFQDDVCVTVDVNIITYDLYGVALGWDYLL